MPLYKFKTSDAGGKVGELLIEGDSQADATRRLHRRGVIPLEFLGEGSLSSGRGRGFSLGSRFDVIDFTDRLVPLLEADIPLERALGILGEGLDKPFTARVVSDMRRGLHEGRKFSQLIRDRGHLFPRLYSSVVEAGEEAGALPQVMAELRRFLNESRELRSFVVSASIYPIVVLTVSLGMVGILLGVIVPRFAAVLKSAGRDDLPASTELLLNASYVVRDFWWAIPILLGILVLLIREFREDGRLRRVYDEFVLRVPVIRHMVLMSNLARMARTMAILMRSGVHLLQTVSIAARVLQNVTLRQSISGLAAELRQGQRLSHALGHSRFIPQYMLRMLAVGEETGAVEQMLDRVADGYETRLRRLIRRCLSLFEPAVIVLLGLVVAGIVVTMFLAIMDMQGGI